MKKLTTLIVLIICLQACEKVIDVDLPTEKPKLVIEATGIQQEQDSLGKLTVKLSKTAPFFQDSIPRVSGAEISVELSNQTIQLAENPENNGIYEATIPMVYGEDYTLAITINGETYQGKTQLHSSVPIDYVTQEEGTFDTDNTQIKAYFTDPAETENYYYFRFISKYGLVLDYADDEYFNGNQVSTFYTDDFDAGDTVIIKIQGSDADFNLYIGKVLEQSQSGGGPFSTAPATIHGNMVNLTNSKEFPLGYFRIAQEFEKTYSVE